MVLPALRHRVLLNFEGEADRVDPDAILEGIIASAPEHPIVKGPAYEIAPARVGGGAGSRAMWGTWSRATPSR